jgi:predicted nucleotidyltransferase
MFCAPSFFGSFARRQADSQSDLDLLLVEGTDLPFLERGLEHLPLYRLGIGIDLLVYTPEEYRRLREEGNPLIERVEKEGITIYARPES